MKTMKRTVTGIMLAVTMLAAGGAWAGNLTPPGAPGATMNTLAELYQKLTNTLAEAQAANQKLVTTTQQVAVLQQQLAVLEARLNADGKHVTVGDMVLIPAGSFVMGADRKSVV